MADRDLYDVLGVPKDASPQDIKKAFRALAKELHPDVAGNDPVKAARFKDVAAAYETLGDVDRRGQYDRARTRRANPPPRGGRTWPGGFDFGGNGGSGPRPPPPTGDLDLEDIFTDFNATDFGFGSRANREKPRPEPRPGRDIHVIADIASHIAQRGGTLTLHYQRLKRSESGNTLVRVEELHDLRVPPGTNPGDTLRVERLGDAGENGGPYGDLVVDVRIVAGEEEPPPGRRGGWDPPPDRRGWDPPPASGPRMRFNEGRKEPAESVQVVDVTIGEAVLGGRIPVETPSGVVRIAIPAGTSSGTRFRVRGKGAPGPGGAPTDLVAEVRIVVPKELDAESRRLMERFAELNPKVDG